MAASTETVIFKKGSDEVITRFDIHQIIQHAVLMVSFTLLVLTGFPLKFHESAVSQWWAGVWGGIDTARLVHRFAAWALVIICLYHVVYIFYSFLVLKRPFPVKMLPTLRDFIGFFQELGYFVGLRKERPKFDRFHWREKVEYWAIVWGVAIMGASGFILIFPVLVTNFLPGWVIPAALVAHSFEAMMALVWIVLVHIFFSHFTPGVFPLNTSIFTGKVPKERYRREHPLEYERLLGGAGEKAEVDANDKKTEVDAGQEEPKG